MTSQAGEAPALDEELEKTIEAEGGSRLTPAQWAEIREHYELGTMDGPEICERYGIKADTLKKRLLRHGVKKGSRAAEMAAAAGASAKAAAAAPALAVPVPPTPVRTAEEIVAERKAQIESAKRQHLEWNESLMKLAVGRLVSAQRDGRPLSSEDANLKSIERTMKIVRMGRQERWDLLDAHDEVDEREMPALTIKNLTDQRIKELRERQEEEDGDIIDDGSLDLTLKDGSEEGDADEIVEEDGDVGA